MLQVTTDYRTNVYPTFLPWQYPIYYEFSDNIMTYKLVWCQKKRHMWSFIVCSFYPGECSRLPDIFLTGGLISRMTANAFYT